MKKYLVQRLESQEDGANAERPRKRSRNIQRQTNSTAEVKPLFITPPPVNSYKLRINAYERFARRFIHECNRQSSEDFSAFLRSHLKDDFSHIGRHYDRERVTNPAPQNPARIKNYCEVHGVDDFLTYFTGFFSQFPDALFLIGDVHVSCNVTKHRSTLVLAYQVTGTVCPQLPVNDPVLKHPKSKTTDDLPPNLAIHLAPSPSDNIAIVPLSADSTSVERASTPSGSAHSSEDSVSSSEDASAEAMMPMEVTLRGYIVMQFEEFDVHNVSRIDFHYYLHHAQPSKVLV
ncbi:hypothetical protein EON65_57455 [archaeon]|nr:MAG: hypothetical protein EON65_57455 [archaeon]